MGDFKYTAKQQKVLDDTKISITKEYDEICLNGGRRSGKTFIILTMIIWRAIVAPGSIHRVVRSTTTSIIGSIWNETIKNQMLLIPRYRKLFEGCKFNESRHTITFPNNSVIEFIGLDNTEALLGKEMSSIYFNECSDIKFEKLETASGLASKREIVVNGESKGLLPVMKFYDFNPPYKTHWTYKYFVLKEHPETGIAFDEEKVKRMYVVMRMNPDDNLENINNGYAESLRKEGGDYAKRYADGEFLDEIKGALFNMSLLNSADEISDDIQGMTRPGLCYKINFKKIVIGIDPAVSTNEKSDLTGISVCGFDGEFYYVLEDRSGRYTATEWGRLVNNLCEAWNTGEIVIETNQGGNLLATNIQATNATHRKLNITEIHASRDVTREQDIFVSNPKLARATSVKDLYERGLVKHVNYYKGDHELNKLDLLKQQMFSYNGLGKSPDRMDAMVYAMNFLYENFTTKRRNPFRSLTYQEIENFHF